MSLSVRERLGPYEIAAQIGAVGTGKAYRVHDPRLNRDAAIKDHFYAGFGFGSGRESQGGFQNSYSDLAARISSEPLKVDRNYYALLRNDLHE